ncbi:hypothetical protein CP02DC22_1082A, partial [Chlamydia psittaci 02DC22]
MTTTQDNK